MTFKKWVTLKFWRFSVAISCSVVCKAKGLDLSIVIPTKEIVESIRKKMHFISVAKLLRLSILRGIRNLSFFSLLIVYLFSNQFKI